MSFGFCFYVSIITISLGLVVLQAVMGNPLIGKWFVKREGELLGIFAVAPGLCRTSDPGGGLFDCPLRMAVCCPNHVTLYLAYRPAVIFCLKTLRQKSSHLSDGKPSRQDVHLWITKNSKGQQMS